jgi:hypothetical protein
MGSFPFERQDVLVWGYSFAKKILSNTICQKSQMGVLEDFFTAQQLLQKISSCDQERGEVFESIGSAVKIWHHWITDVNV